LCITKTNYVPAFVFFHFMARRRSWLERPLPVVIMDQADSHCGLCQRKVAQTSRHHLIPREEGGRYGPTVNLCQPCHSSVHRFLSNRDLARHYPTVEALRGAEELQTYLNWIRKQRVERIANRRARR
jgi:5-methylcytosine-specific restriction protein A